MIKIFQAIYSFLTHRLFIFLLIVGVMFYILVLRLFQLQIIEGANLESEFELSVLKEITIDGKRGNIYDRNGYPLAENKIAFSVQYDDSVSVTDKNELFYRLIHIIKRNGDELIQSFPISVDEDQNYIFTQSDTQVLRFKKVVFNKKTLTAEQTAMNAQGVILYMKNDLFELVNPNYTTQDIMDILSIRYALYVKRYSKFMPQDIAYNISQKTLAEIEESRDLLPGVSIQEDSLRVYNDPYYFSHIIGYTGKIDQDTLATLEPQGYSQDSIIGKIGIEKELETYLKGQNGQQVVEVDNLGRTMATVETLEPIAGKDVYLTIDAQLQKVSQDALISQLAKILAEKLVMRKPTTGETRVPVLKDVFYSLFKYEHIDINKLEIAPKETHQYKIYTSFNNQYEDIVDSLTTDLTIGSDVTYKSSRMTKIYAYILKTLSTNQFLLDGYKETDEYAQYEKSQLSFQDLLLALINNNLITLPSKEGEKMPSDASGIYTYIKDQLILKDYVLKNTFKREIYLDLVDNESFTYLDLCDVLIEQGIVTATELEKAGLSKKKLAPLDFIKSKILSLELTPSMLALDPSSGAVVVVNVKTGEVLSLVSYPGYDNNRLVNNFDYDYYLQLLKEPAKPLFPMATQGKTAPGSTFKMVTATAGLEENIISKNETITCTGHFTKVNPNVACWIAAYGSTHGPVNVKIALAVSCNSFFNEVGYRLGFGDSNKYSPQKGIDTLVEYVQKFGLTEKSGVELDEAEPSIPGSVEGGIVNPVTAAMGQEFNAYTPTQIARYIATLANGGTLFKLTLIDQVKTADGYTFFDQQPQLVQENNFDPKNIAAVKEGMWEVANGPRGTLRTTFADFPITIAAKTGTAQQIKTRPSHAINVSFAPYENPEIAVVVVIPFGYTAQYGGKVAKEIYNKYFEFTTTPSAFTTGSDSE